MADKTVLAELAERLTPGLIVNVDGQATAKDVDFEALTKAQRIVAELAKVKVVRNHYSNEICWPTTSDVMDAFEKIIAIAEEGAGDGK